MVRIVQTLVKGVDVILNAEYDEKLLFLDRLEGKRIK